MRLPLLQAGISRALTTWLAAGLVLGLPPLASMVQAAAARQSASDYPCSLLTTDEVGAAFGAPYRVTGVQAHGPVEDDYPGRTCVYGTGDQQYPSIFTLAILRASDVGGDSDLVRVIFKDEQAYGGDNVLVPNVGDDAFLNQSGLHVLRDDVYVNVGVIYTRPWSPEPSVAQLWPLAQHALDRAR